MKKCILFGIAACFLWTVSLFAESFSKPDDLIRSLRKFYSAGDRMSLEHDIFGDLSSNLNSNDTQVFLRTLENPSKYGLQISNPVHSSTRAEDTQDRLVIVRRDSDGRVVKRSGGTDTYACHKTETFISTIRSGDREIGRFRVFCDSLENTETSTRTTALTEQKCIELLAAISPVPRCHAHVEIEELFIVVNFPELALNNQQSAGAIACRRRGGHLLSDGCTCADGKRLDRQDRCPNNAPPEKRSENPAAVP